MVLLDAWLRPCIARGAEARATRIREEAERDAAIAWSDVRALEQQLDALEASYIASRRSRDKASCVAERPADMRADSEAVRQA